jgi:hypothetical protein
LALHQGIPAYRLLPAAHSFISCAFTESLNCARIVPQTNKKAAVKIRAFFNCVLLQSLFSIIENLFTHLLVFELKPLSKLKLYINNRT